MKEGTLPQLDGPDATERVRSGHRKGREIEERDPPPGICANKPPAPDARAAGEAAGGPPPPWEAMFPAFAPRVVGARPPEMMDEAHRPRRPGSIKGSGRQSFP